MSKKKSTAAIWLIGGLIVFLLLRRRVDTDQEEEYDTEHHEDIEITGLHWHHLLYKSGDFMKLNMTVKSNLTGHFKIVLRSDILRWYTFRDLEAGSIIDTSLVGWASDNVGTWPTYLDIYLWEGWEKWHAGETELMHTMRVSDLVIG